MDSIINSRTNLIVMLTYNDKTVAEAYRIFDQAKESKAQIWGFKEEGISSADMKELFAYMKRCGKITALEVVAYTEEECIKGAELAKECNCDILMGTKYYDSVNLICKNAGLKYLPFIGDVYDRPSILSGSYDEMLREIDLLDKNGVFGADLLSYRYDGDVDSLNKTVIGSSNLPICIAGSIDSYEKLDVIKKLSPWAFTIGSAFFENRFGDSFEQQINTVYNYINEKVLCEQ